jgi:hypothetical protein
MLKIAVQYAGIWNSIGSIEGNTPLKKILQNTYEQNQLLDQNCDKIGRNPQQISHSFLLFAEQLRKNKMKNHKLSIISPILTYLIGIIVI